LCLSQAKTWIVNGACRALFSVHCFEVLLMLVALLTITGGIADQITVLNFIFITKRSNKLLMLLNMIGFTRNTIFKIF
jgi:hypothetical protein